MRPERQGFIRARARDLQVELWRRRSELAPGARSVEDLLPFSPRLFIEGLLNLRLEEPQEIPSILGLNTWSDLDFEVAGYLDRPQKLIVAAQKFKPDWRRYTMSHEAGHYLLHTELIQHRDRPLTGGERANVQRSTTEQEADLFAAELLMPSKLVRHLFFERFDGILDGRRPNDSLAAWLSAGTSQSIKASELASKGPQYRALLIARTNLFQGKSFLSLSETFGVSPTAMAIQLRDLQLVL